MRNEKHPKNKLKKYPVTKNCSDLSLFEQIFLVISKFLHSSFSLEIQKKFSITRKFFFHSRSEHFW